jgi:RNA polymerase sigma-70 factor (ECF subfamily)
MVSILDTDALAQAGALRQLLPLTTVEKCAMMRELADRDDGNLGGRGGHAAENRIVLRRPSPGLMVGHPALHGRHHASAGAGWVAGSSDDPYPFRRLSGKLMGVDKSPSTPETSTTRDGHSRSPLLSLVTRERRQAISRKDQREEHLVESAIRGDTQAVGELYRRHVDMIYRYTYGRVRDAVVAEDLTAQVFLKALEGLSNYRPTGAPFRAWLYRIAHARTVDYWRRQGRCQEVVLVDTLVAKDPSPDDVTMTRSEWSMAVELLGELTDDQRDVILLRFIEEMSLADVAETLDKTVGAVKALQHRALATLVRLREERMTLPGDRDD